MRKHAIHQFLGQTTLDPNIERAYYEGCIANVLWDFNLEPDLIRNISTIQAASFDEFLCKAFFSAIGNQPEPGSEKKVPHPLDGLHPYTKIFHSQAA